jgi:DNA-binding transcriptional LysR family regulator
MDIRGIDLNLLVVFDAMARHRSVTRAAEAIGLSQPAMSAALGRLRVLFGDPLFVKIGAEMQPTARATELASPVQRVIGVVKGEILQAQPFDPRSAERAFTIIAPDIAEIKLLPALLTWCAREAPHVTLRTLSMPRHAAAQSLESGGAELAVGYFPDLSSAGFYRQKLFAPHLSCIVREGHPSIGERLSLKQYLAASHVLVRPEGRGHLFDEHLKKQGMQRRVVLEISHYMSLLPIIAESDLIATVPHDLAEVCARHARIRVLPSPVKSPAVEVHQFWHGRFNKDPGNVWLRNSIHRLLGR